MAHTAGYPIPLHAHVIKMAVRLMVASHHFVHVELLLCIEFQIAARTFEFTFAASLFHRHINEVLILKSKLLSSVVRRNSFTINHETNLRCLESQTAAVCVPKLAKRRGLLDFELYLASLLIFHLQLNVRCCCCCVCHRCLNAQQVGGRECS